MAGSSIGEGALKLTADTSGLITSLKKANGEISAFSAKTKEATANLGGSLGAILETGGKFGAIGLAIAGAIELGKNMSGLVTRTQMFTDELERSKSIAEGWSAVVSGRIERSSAAISALSDIAGTKEGISLTAKELSKFEDNLSSTAAQLTVAKNEVSKLTSVWQENNDTFRAWLVGEKESLLNDAKEKRDELKKTYDQQFQYAQKLRAMQKDIADPANNVAAQAELRKFVVEMNDAIKSLTVSADTIKIDKLKEQFGFSEAQVGAARLAALAKEAAVAADELDKFQSEQYNSDRNADIVKIEELTEKFKWSAEQIQKANDAVFARNDRSAQKWIRELQIDLGMIRGEFKKNSDEMKLDELVQAGIDQKHIDRIKKLIDYKKILETPYTPLKSIQYGSASDFELRNRVKAERDKDFMINQDKILKDILQQLIKINLGISAIDREVPEI